MNNFIQWSTLDFKKTKGTEKVKCPNCDAQKQRKGDRPIQVNHNEGFGKCFRCESLTFKEEVKKQSEKQYTNLQNNVTKIANNELKIKSYINTRKINESTLKSLYVTFENYYQPAKGKEVDNIVFNYYEGSKLVNKKYRSADKKFTQTKGGKPIFYNINSVIGENEVYIVEGEFDVLAMVEAGFKNTISVPNGANDNDEYWKNSEKYIKDIKKFIIAVDNDEKGNDLKEKIAQRLGRYRCEFIEWENKDANGDLINDCLIKSVQNKKRFPVNGTFTVSDLKESILDLYNNGLPETIKPKAYYFRQFSKIFSLMRGQLTVGTGIPSHGKSNFTDNLVLNLVNDYDLKASWFSPEHSPMSLYQTNLMEKVTGKNFWKDKQDTNGNIVKRISKQDINDYEEWANEKIYLTGSDGDKIPTWSWLLEKFKEQMYSFGIDIFVIDAFNKVILPKGMSKIDAINDVLTKLTHFAQSNNVLVFLIAHPTKMRKDEKTQKYEVPDLYSVSGSADFRNQTHNGFSIYRTFGDNESGTEASTDFYNMKTKFNFQGVIGEKVSFNYCLVNGRYYEKGTKEPTFSLITGEQKEEIPKINPAEAFLNDDFDDKPF